MRVRDPGVIHVEPRLCRIIAKRELVLDDVVCQLGVRCELEGEIAVHGHLEVQRLQIFRGVVLAEVLDCYIYGLLGKCELLRVAEVELLLQCGCDILVVCVFQTLGLDVDKAFTGLCQAGNQCRLDYLALIGLVLWSVGCNQIVRELIDIEVILC